MRLGDEIGRHSELKILCRKAYGFESHPSYQFERSTMEKLKEIFNYEYVGGGYFREKGVKKGDTAKILHGMQAIEYLLDKVENN